MTGQIGHLRGPTFIPASCTLSPDQKKRVCFGMELSYQTELDENFRQIYLCRKFIIALSISMHQHRKCI